jgi:RimJ/RimL family protein N-acetyltransferase
MELEGSYRAIGLEQGGKLIGGALYTQYCGGAISISVAGNKGWLTRSFLRAAFAYPFIQLGLRRVTAYVASRNMASRRLTESVGFVQESIMERAGKDDDYIVYRLFREDCKW